MIRHMLVQATVLVAAAALAGLGVHHFHPGAPALYVTAEKAPEGSISVMDARTLTAGAGVIWLDARRRTEYEKQHIPGALLCNEAEWESVMEPVILAMDAAPGRTIVIYCDAMKCQASKEIQARLLPLIPDGRPVLVLHGGWPAWQASLASPEIK